MKDTKTEAAAATATRRHKWTFYRVRDFSEAKGTDRLVLYTIASYANKDGIARPGAKAIARGAGLDEGDTSKVWRSIKRLVDAGELERLETGGGKGNTNNYRVLPAGDPNSATTASFTGERNSAKSGSQTVPDRGPNSAKSSPNSAVVAPEQGKEQGKDEQGKDEQAGDEKNLEDSSSSADPNRAEGKPSPRPCESGEAANADSDSHDPIPQPPSREEAPQKEDQLEAEREAAVLAEVLDEREHWALELSKLDPRYTFEDALAIYDRDSHAMRLTPSIIRPTPQQSVSRAREWERKQEELRRKAEEAEAKLKPKGKLSDEERAATAARFKAKAEKEQADYDAQAKGYPDAAEQHDAEVDAAADAEDKPTGTGTGTGTRVSPFHKDAAAKKRGQ